MKAYSIFDDFGEKPAKLLSEAGIELTVHPLGTPRPDADQMKEILEQYDCVIIGTSQKITCDMFENITDKRIIATASVGTDHIQIPTDKKEQITIINTPMANAQSVAEYTISCALFCCKRLAEGNALYLEGKDNKSLRRKPEDLYGRTIGVIGAGNISVRILEYAKFLGMKLLCWTRNPDHHKDLTKLGVQFVDLETLAISSDVISVNLPNTPDTEGLISELLVNLMKETAIFISVSRLATINLEALLHKADRNPNFYVCLDIDPDVYVSQLAYARQSNHIFITPHIAGGTIETRKRMFLELAEKLQRAVKE